MPRFNFDLFVSTQMRKRMLLLQAQNRPLTRILVTKCINANLLTFLLGFQQQSKAKQVSLSFKVISSQPVLTALPKASSFLSTPPHVTAPGFSLCGC